MGLHDAASLRSLSKMVEGFALIHLVGDIYTIYPFTCALQVSPVVVLVPWIEL